jgi:hypothetical protein
VEVRGHRVLHILRAGKVDAMLRSALQERFTTPENEELFIKRHSGLEMYPGVLVPAATGVMVVLFWSLIVHSNVSREMSF